MLSPPVASQPWIGENSKEFALLRLSRELCSLPPKPGGLERWLGSVDKGSDPFLTSVCACGVRYTTSPFKNLLFWTLCLDQLATIFASNSLSYCPDFFQ